MKKTWSDQQLIEAVTNSNTYADVSRKLGLTNYGANSHTIKKYIERLNLDTSHFLTRNEQLKLAREEKVTLTFEEIFAINDLDRKFIKNKILKENLLPYICSNCNISTWKDLPLSLHLDHINGIPNDNRLENLRFLCPNCHSQTETYCGKNISQTIVNHSCIDCGIKMHKDSKRCVKCASKRRKTKIKWGSIEELAELVKELGYMGAGRKLGVSDNSIRKFLKKNNIKV